MPETETIQLSQLSHTLEGSKILELSNAVKARMQQGATVYNYTVGDFDPGIFPIPRQLKKEILKAYEEDWTNYPAAEGNADLRLAISEFVKEWNWLEYKPGEILVASGGRPLIYAAYRAICDQGEKIVYAVPSWNNNYYTHFVGGEHIVIDTCAENGFLPRAEDLEPFIKEAVLISLCSPQNPTGTVYSREELEAICNLIVEENKRRGKTGKKCYLLYDQMYGLLTYNVRHNDPVSVNPEMRPFTIYVDAVSKAFAATGMRVGWALGPTAVLEKMKNILTHMGAWAPMAEQKAVARFLGHRGSVRVYLNGFKNELSERLALIYDGIQCMKKDGLPIDAIEPKAGIYLSVKIDLIGIKTGETVIKSPATIAQVLLEKAGLAVLPFYAFGAPEDLPWFRLSVGTCLKEDIGEMLESLRAILEQAMPLKNAECLQ
jgi:aspartate aminotransferase